MFQLSCEKPLPVTITPFVVSRHAQCSWMKCSSAERAQRRNIKLVFSVAHRSSFCRIHRKWSQENVSEIYSCIRCNAIAPKWNLRSKCSHTLTTSLHVIAVHVDFHRLHALRSRLQMQRNKTMNVDNNKRNAIHFVWQQRFVYPSESTWCREI